MISKMRNCENWSTPVFTDGIADFLLDDDYLAREVSYNGNPVRAFPVVGAEQGSIGKTQPVSSAIRGLEGQFAEIRVKKSEVPAPVLDDEVDVDGELYRVKTWTPLGDMWLLSCLTKERMKSGGLF